MANTQIGNTLGLTDRNHASAALDIDTADTVSAMRTRLAAISGTTYTAAVLNAMTVNDMIYAIRLNDNPTTI